jgi:hypothetical protein
MSLRGTINPKTKLATRLLDTYRLTRPTQLTDGKVCNDNVPHTANINHLKSGGWLYGLAALTFCMYGFCIILNVMTDNYMRQR